MENDQAELVHRGGAIVVAAAAPLIAQIITACVPLPGEIQTFACGLSADGSAVTRYCAGDMYGDGLVDVDDPPGLEALLLI